MITELVPTYSEPTLPALILEPDTPTPRPPAWMTASTMESASAKLSVWGIQIFTFIFFK